VFNPRQQRFYSWSFWPAAERSAPHRFPHSGREAEKKAAGLPPKLTVPMILFFLPVRFVVILGPAAIKVMALQ
jgi:hypothetical protein